MVHFDVVLWSDAVLDFVHLIYIYGVKFLDQTKYIKTKNYSINSEKSDNCHESSKDKPDLF